MEVMILDRFSGIGNQRAGFIGAEWYFTFLGFDEEYWLPLPSLFFAGFKVSYTSICENDSLQPEITIQVLDDIKFGEVRSIAPRLSLLVPFDGPQVVRPNERLEQDMSTRGITIAGKVFLPTLRVECGIPDNHGVCIATCPIGSCYVICIYIALTCPSIAYELVADENDDVFGEGVLNDNTLYLSSLEFILFVIKRFIEKFPQDERCFFTVVDQRLKVNVQMPRHNNVSWRGNSGLQDGQYIDLIMFKYLMVVYDDAGDELQLNLPLFCVLTMLSWSVSEHLANYEVAVEPNHVRDVIMMSILRILWPRGHLEKLQDFSCHNQQ
ncbi:hypothetical protein MTR67_024347 [Solanum verrucosum]|uniref:cellulase n=1 Tax=Solanum verrucosum TaxID=315347 RepID=A0AAF0QYP5_SOLVR|nr:hypothetical protein MTR67_024347 [Solanum verrucosum]